LSGKLVVTGAGQVNFPTSAADVTATASALIKLGGNPSVAGNVGKANIFVGVNGQTSAFKIDAAAVFTTAGNLLGKDATISVTGSMKFDGASIEGLLDIKGNGAAMGTDGKVEITLAKFTGGDLKLASEAELKIGTPSSVITFKKFAECSADSTIVLEVASIADLKAGDYTGFKFNTLTDAEIGNLKCGVKVVDKTGASIDLTPSGSSPAGRRLLAEAKGTYTYKKDSLAYNVGGGNGAGSVQASIFCVLGAAAFAVIARLF